MGFETQEEAERWAEGVELRADARREERMLKTETDERNGLPSQHPIIGLRKPWVWVQPKDRDALILRLLEASEYKVHERERENLCRLAYDALRDDDA